MSKYRTELPQLTGNIFLTDGGIETTLIFHEGIDLPYFAAFDLLKTEQGRASLKRYYETYAKLATNANTGFILESPTWRASSDWAEKMDYDEAQLADANKQAIQLMSEIREAYMKPTSAIVISGCVGPRGDGYLANERMSIEEATNYHQQQIATFAGTAADLITAITIPYPEEAIGIVKAAQLEDMPVVIAFTTETDGCLPSGESLGEAISTVDEATNNGPEYFMISCAHPDHFQQALSNDEAWLKRIGGLRANASRKSHAELDEAEEIDIGSPEELGFIYKQLLERLPQINVLGGCCGTDHRHLEQISKACVK